MPASMKLNHYQKLQSSFSCSSHYSRRRVPSQRPRLSSLPLSLLFLVRRFGHPCPRHPSYSNPKSRFSYFKPNPGETSCLWIHNNEAQSLHCNFQSSTTLLSVHQKSLSYLESLFKLGFLLEMHQFHFSFKLIWNHSILGTGIFIFLKNSHASKATHP